MSEFDDIEEIDLAATHTGSFKRYRQAKKLMLAACDRNRKAPKWRKQLRAPRRKRATVTLAK